MKRIIVICLCIILLACNAIPVLAAADATMTLKTDKQTLMQGEQVTITLDIKTEKACNSFGMIMVYDAKVFEVVSGDCDSAALVKEFNEERGFVALYLLPGKLDKEVGHVTLKVRANAPVGATTFTGKTSVKNGDDVLDCDINTLTFQIEKAQAQTPSQPTQTPSQPTQTTETTQATTAETTEQTKPDQTQEGTVPSASEPIITIGQTAPVVEKKNDILLIAAIAVAVVAAMAVGGYFILKKKR